MARDEAYYDHDQLTAEEKAILDARGQSDAATNIIKPIVDWMVGTGRRMRFDTNVLPRGREDSAQAEQKSKLLKYLRDANRSQFERSSAFSEATKAGLSWVEVESGRILTTAATVEPVCVVAQCLSRLDVASQRS